MHTIHMCTQLRDISFQKVNETNQLKKQNQYGNVR